MENSIQKLMENLSINRDGAIHIYNEICNEFNSTFTHEETIEKANNIISSIFVR